MDTGLDIHGTALNEIENAKLFRAHFEIRDSKILLFCDDEPVRGDYIEVDDVEFLEKNKVICDSRDSDWRTKVFLCSSEFRRFETWWQAYGTQYESESEETETEEIESETDSDLELETPSEPSRGWFSWLW